MKENLGEWMGGWKKEKVVRQAGAIYWQIKIMEKCFEYIIGLLDGMAGYCKSPATIQHTTYICYIQYTIKTILKICR